MSSASQHLAGHATLILLYGLLLGAPYAKSIKLNATAQVINSWRVAHQSLPLGAAIMFSVAAVLPMLVKSEAVAWVITVCLTVSSYAFCVSTPLAALTQDRGLTAGSRGWGRLVYWGNLIGAVSSVVGAMVLAMATWLALL